MGNCQKCFRREEEVQNEIKLEDEIYSIINLEKNSPKKENILESEMKAETNILSSEIYNINNLEQNIFGENRNEIENNDSFFDENSIKSKKYEDDTYNHFFEGGENEQYQNEVEKAFKENEKQIYDNKEEQIFGVEKMNNELFEENQEQILDDRIKNQNEESEELDEKQYNNNFENNTNYDKYFKNIENN